MPEVTQDKRGWKRLFLSLLFLIILGYIVLPILILSWFVQTLLDMLRGRANVRLADFIGQLADYARSIVRYVGHTDDLRPFPFGAWPGRQSTGPDARSPADDPRT